MKIEVDILGWTDTCCGCKRMIGKDEKVYMISQLLGVTGSIHLCEECISKLNFKGIKLTNINLTGISQKEQFDKYLEEEGEFRTAYIDYKFTNSEEHKEHLIEEYFDLLQSSLGLMQKLGISAEEVMKEYPKHLEKIKNRPRIKLKDNNNYDDAED